jgi:hypothetical protein
MDVLRLIGEIDKNGRLSATVPTSVPPGRVELVVVGRVGAEDDAGDNWASGVAREWEDELADSHQDIYSLADGAPVE